VELKVAAGLESLIQDAVAAEMVRGMAETREELQQCVRTELSTFHSEVHGLCWVADTLAVAQLTKSRIERVKSDVSALRDVQGTIAILQTQRMEDRELIDQLMSSLHEMQAALDEVNRQLAKLNVPCQTHRPTLFGWS
jgi:chromosome segregation ATPase